MSCAEYTANLTRILASLNYPPKEVPRDIVAIVKDGLYNIGIPIMCIFGILGNILNVVVLTRKQMSRAMDRMEKSVHYGLIALAVSDLLFCVVILPSAFIPQERTYIGESSMGMIYYNMYMEPFINMFLLSSTWLTIMMASGRYLAVCHPIRARWVLGMKVTRFFIASVFVLAVTINMPQFWKNAIMETNCATHCYCYTIITGELYKNKTFEFAYNIFWSLAGVFIPLFILAFCNFCLIKALKDSQRMRKMYRANKSSHDSGHRLTPTLISIVVLFMVLVSPSEILKFLQQYVVNQQHPEQLEAYQTAVVVTNFMQVSNDRAFVFQRIRVVMCWLPWHRFFNGKFPKFPKFTKVYYY